MALTDAIVLLLPLLTLQYCVVRSHAEHVHGKRHPEHAGGLRNKADQSPRIDSSVYIPSHFIQYPHPRFSPVLEILKQRQKVQGSRTLQSAGGPPPDTANVETVSSGQKSPVKREIQETTRRLQSVRRSDSLSPAVISNDLSTEHRALPLVRKLQLDSSELEGLPSGDYDVFFNIPDAAEKSKSVILSKPSRSISLNEEMNLNSLEQSFPSRHSSSSVDLSSSVGKQSSTANNSSSTPNHVMPSSSSTANNLISFPLKQSANYVTFSENLPSPSDDRRSSETHQPNTIASSPNNPSIADERAKLSSSPSVGHSTPSKSAAPTREYLPPAAPFSPDRQPFHANNPTRVMEESAPIEKLTNTAKNTSPVQKNKLPDEIASKILPSILQLMQALQSTMVRYGSTYESEFISDGLPAIHDEVPYAAAVNTQRGVVHYHDPVDHTSKVSPMTSFPFGDNGKGKKIPILSPPTVHGRILGYVGGFTM